MHQFIAFWPGFGSCYFGGLLEGDGRAEVGLHCQVTTTNHLLLGLHIFMAPVCYFTTVCSVTLLL